MANITNLQPSTRVHRSHGLRAPPGRARVRLDARDGGRGRLVLLLGLHRDADTWWLPGRALPGQSRLWLGHSNQRLSEHAAAHSGQSWISIRDAVAYFSRLSRGKFACKLAGWLASPWYKIHVARARPTLERPAESISGGKLPQASGAHYLHSGRPLSIVDFRCHWAHLDPVA